MDANREGSLWDKAVVDPAKEVSPIDRLKGWVDEFGSAKNLVVVLEGEITLCEGHHSEIVLKTGDAAGWKADSGVGHCLINRTEKDAVYIEAGTRVPHDTVVYPDIDMRAERDKTGQRYVKKTGEPYPVRKV